MNSRIFPARSWLVSAVCALAGAGGAALVLPPPASAPSRPSPGLRESARFAGAVAKNLSPGAAARLAALTNAGTPVRQLAAVLQFSEISDPAEIRELLENAGKFPPHSAADLAIHALLKRWLELDPAAALEYARVREEKVLPGLIGTWSITDPDGARAFILTLPAGEAKTNAWKQLAEVTAGTDPAKAWNLLAHTPVRPGYDYSYEIRPVVERLVALDVEGTIQKLPDLPPALQHATRTAIVGKLMASDPVRGWEWVRSQPWSDSLAGEALAQAVKADPAQGLAFLNDLPADQRGMLLKNYSYFWQHKDPALMASALGQDDHLSAPEKNALAGQLFSRAMHQDRGNAKVFLSLMDETTLQHQLPVHLLQLSQRDPEAAAAWITSLPAGVARRIAEQALAEKPAEAVVDDGSARSLLLELQQGYHYIEGNDPRLAKLSAGEVAAVLDNPFAGSGSGSLLSGLAKLNPAATAAWVETLELNQTTGPQAAQFSAHWAAQDPAAAAAWISTLPAGPVQEAARKAAAGP